jgi:hypothetical protein
MARAAASNGLLTPLIWMSLLMGLTTLFRLSGAADAVHEETQQLDRSQGIGDCIMPQD